MAAACGLIASCAAAVVGIAALAHSPEITKSNPTSAGLITVGPRVPLSDQEVVALVGRVPNFGALSDPAACRVPSGSPATAPNRSWALIRCRSGANRPWFWCWRGRHDELIVFAVAPSCSAVDTGLIADRTIHRP